MAEDSSQSSGSSEDVQKADTIQKVATGVEIVQPELAPIAEIVKQKARQDKEEALRKEKEELERKKQEQPAMQPMYGGPEKPSLLKRAGAAFLSWMFHRRAFQSALILLFVSLLSIGMGKMGFKWGVIIGNWIVVGGTFFAVYRLDPDKMQKIIRFFIHFFGGITLFIAGALLHMPPIFIASALFVWMMWVFVEVKGPKKVLIFGIYFMLYLMIFYTGSYKLYLNPQSPLYEALEGQEEAWVDLFKPFTQAYQAVEKGIERQYYYALGEYEMGVEEQSERPLGVFLENIGTTSKIVKDDQFVDVFARLRAETFKTDVPLEVNVDCYADGNKKDYQGEIRPIDTFQVEEYESQDIDCILDAQNLGVGVHNIDLVTNFNFQTSAFLKTYFMEQERVRSFRRENVDPLDAFKITDKSPMAVFTPGPMRIGMGIGQQPISLVSDVEYGPTLGITFENNWQGKLVEVSEVMIIAPPGLKIEDVDGYKDSDGLECSGGTTEEHVCYLKGDLVKKVLDPEKLKREPIITIRVHTLMAGSDPVGTLLANAPLAIRSFKVEAKYKYELKKSISVTVRPAKKAIGT